MIKYYQLYILPSMSESSSIHEPTVVEVNDALLVECDEFMLN